MTRNRLNAQLWARQGFAAKKSRAVLDVARRCFALYGSAPTCYLSLAARIPDFRLGDLDEETVERRRLVRWRAMRLAQVLLPVSDLPMTFQATKDLPRADYGATLSKMGIDGDLYRRTAEVVEALVAERPRSAAELRAAFEPDREPLRQGLPFVVGQMCREGRLVPTAARGGWKSGQFEYARMTDWLPDVDLAALRPEAARRELARRYFSTWGPATEADFQWWIGLTRRQAGAVLRDLDGELSEVDVLGLRERYLALEKDRPALESRSGPVPHGVALLPVWDAYLMAYADRERFLEPKWTDRIFDASGNATSAVLWNGRVAGVWGFEQLDSRLRVKVAPLADFPLGAWAAARRVAKRLARLTGKRDLILERCPPPRPLSEGVRQQFLAPLKGVSGMPV